MSRLKPEANKFHVGNGGDGKHYLANEEVYIRDALLECARELEAALAHKPGAGGEE